VRLFPGGHFYMQAGKAEFLAALAADLEQENSSPQRRRDAEEDKE
jgi:surfactin synthase thioesterase subunit